MASLFAVEVAVRLFGNLMDDLDRLRGRIQACRDAEDPGVAADHAVHAMEELPLVLAELRQWDRLHAETKLTLAPVGSEHLARIERAKELRRALRAQADAVRPGPNSESKVYQVTPAEWVALWRAMPDADNLLSMPHRSDLATLKAEVGRAFERVLQRSLDAANALLAAQPAGAEQIEQLVHHAEEALLTSRKAKLLPDAAEALFEQIRQLP